MAKKAKAKEIREISREERVTGKAPADESPRGLDPDSREYHALHGDSPDFEGD